MKCAILQPSYIPWRGVFHQIQKVDLFIFYDDVQYDKHGWRNRNRIKTANGPIWLTIPVRSKGNTTQHTPINGIRVVDHKWNAKHWTTIQLAYRKARYFSTYAPLLERIYQQESEWLADFTIDSTVALARAAGIQQTRFLRSSTIPAEGQKTDRLIQILRAVGASHYVSGPSAADYIDAGAFRAEGISLEYMVYDYPEYEQLYPPFDPNVSIVDLLFSVGPRALDYIVGR
jgi:hypothetical protein